MKIARRRNLLGVLVAATLLAGCAPVGTAAPPAAAPTDGAQDDGAASTTPPEPAEAGAGRALPAITSCDQISAVAPDYVAELTLEQDNSYIQDDALSCSWSPAEGSITSLTDIKTFSVTITADDSEIPDPTQMEQYGIKGYFTDPRLDALGGVGLWLDADSAVVGGGAGTVIVPGVHVTIGSSLWGQDSELAKDSMVTLALQLFDM
ncbi:hypothetical protein NY547_11735 [Cnuibacter physcomitrellae]|uniref:hypothetical protein n=1 Tax=Cnuibacter physcomitrellae TaxID=1619308 RepID=UPI002175F2EF|nr:hypothetical protein [Cnuibacter physcomitrellae]MCS5497909.1 hypothetical protein [Cnuibacter physcomitrellae]